MAGSSLPEESPSSYVEGIERRLEAARLAETTDDHLADDGIRRRRFTEYASFLPEESLPLTEATLFREPTISTAARARATKTQARFARRLAQKMENRRQDKSTIRRDHALLWTSVAGIAVMMLDFELLLHAPGAYVWGGFVVRCANSLLTLALVAHLHSYYAYLLARKRTNYAPYIRHFLQEPSLRWRFLAELLVCLPHAPPTCLPPLAVPPPHACGLDGYRGGADGLAAAALHDHPACHLHHKAPPPAAKSFTGCQEELHSAATGPPAPFPPSPWLGTTRRCRATTTERCSRSSRRTGASPPPAGRGSSACK